MSEQKQVDQEPSGATPREEAQGKNGHTAAHSNHGNTIAAWTTVGLLIVASLIMCIAVVVTSIWVFVVGAVIAIGALVAGKLLALAGYGMPRPDDNKVTRGVR